MVAPPPRSPSSFPPPEGADAYGLVAVTPTMNVDMLLDAYSHGIFPWSEDPVRWYSPDPRALFVPGHIRLPRRLGKMMRRGGFRVTLDRCFRNVMEACAHRHASEGCWIGPAFLDCYEALHHRGHAHSVEVWQREELVGGLYGVQIGGMYAGESMFYRVSNASKVAFAFLLAHLDACGVRLLDAQVLNAHTANLGAVVVHRSDFLNVLPQALAINAKGSGERWPESPLAIPEAVLGGT